METLTLASILCLGVCGRATQIGAEASEESANYDGLGEIAMLRTTAAVVFLFLFFAMAPTASADGVTWTLTNLTFPDGATITGSFVYDATTNTVTDINVVSSAGLTLSNTTFAGASYNQLAPDFGPFAFEMGFLSGSTSPNFGIELEFYTSPDGTAFQSLTNAGGTVFADINEFTCFDSKCDTFAEIRGTVPGGTVVGVPVKEPSAFLLLGVGVLGLLAIAGKNLSHR